MIKARASDPGFEELFFLVDMYARYKNPHLFYDLRNEDPVLLGSETVALEELIREILDVGEL